MAISHKNGIALTGVSAINGVTSISAINGISATLGAGTSYVTSVDPGSTTENFNINNSYVLGAKITLPAGTVTEMGIYVAETNSSAAAVKLALVDDATKTLITGASGTIDMSGPFGPKNAWYDLTGLSGVITAGDYYVVFAATPFDGAAAGRAASPLASGVGLFEFGLSYASMPASLPSSSPTTSLASVRVLVG